MDNDNIDLNTLLSGFAAEIGRLTQRAVIAETRLAAAQERVKQYRDAEMSRVAAKHVAAVEEEREDTQP